MAAFAHAIPRWARFVLCMVLVLLILALCFSTGIALCLSGVDLFADREEVVHSFDSQMGEYKVLFVTLDGQPALILLEKDFGFWHTVNLQAPDAEGLGFVEMAWITQGTSQFHSSDGQIKAANDAHLLFAGDAAQMLSRFHCTLG